MLRDSPCCSVHPTLLPGTSIWHPSHACGGAEKDFLIPHNVLLEEEEVHHAAVLAEEISAHTCYNGGYRRQLHGDVMLIPKASLSSDWSLQPDSMKLDR